MKISRITVMCALALLIGACGGSDEVGGGSGEDPDGGTTIELVAQDFSFDTASLEVQPGTEVTISLKNEGEAEHTFTIEELDVEAEAQGGETAEASFTAPDSGSYEFFCEYHPDDMNGTFSILGSGGDGGTETEQPDKEKPEKEKPEDGETGGGKQY